MKLVGLTEVDAGEAGTEWWKTRGDSKGWDWLVNAVRKGKACDWLAVLVSAGKATSG